MFKNDSPEIISNYRPISVLPVFSKVFEKCIYRRLSEFFAKCNILYGNQYGFRASHSTFHALLNFVNKVDNSIDKGEFMIGLFIDLSKAFDTLDHNILLYKLQNYGILRGPILDLLTSYLMNRKQYVIVENEKSQYKEIRCGVP